MPIDNNLKRELSNIKEAPSNLSQDAIRVQFNENFRILRKMMGDLFLKILQIQQSNSNSGNQLIFPTDMRNGEKFVVERKNDAWYVTRDLGTQNRIDGDSIVNVGGNHQHIVHKTLEVSPGGELNVNPGGEVVILDDDNIVKLPFDGDGSYEVNFNGIFLKTINITSDGSYTIDVDGEELDVNDGVIIGDVINITNNSGITTLVFQLIQ